MGSNPSQNGRHDPLTAEQVTLFARAWTQDKPTLEPNEQAILAQHAQAWQRVASMPAEDRPILAYDVLSEAKISQADIARITVINTTPAHLARVADDPLIKANRTDAGNADCLAYRHGHDLRYCHTSRGWHVWDGTIWAPDRDQAAERHMLETIRARYHAAPNVAELETRQKLAAWAIVSESTAKREAALRSAQALEQLAITIERFDTAPMLATARNGITINLATGTTYQAKREDLITKALGTDYDPAAKCLRWIEHLGQVFSGNAKMIAFFKRAVGYSLTADTREQKIFLLHGEGANGKSVTLSTLGKLLGDYAGATPFDTFDAETREARHDLAKLKGARLVTVIETNEDRKLNEARIKAITGGDLITAEAKYQMPFDYRPAFKVWVAMNHLPIIRGNDRGIWRRILLVEFGQSFEGREDLTLDKTLEGELPGILNWALEGLREWIANGLNPPESVLEATNQYKRDMDLVGQWIEARASELGAETEAGAAYQNYGQWCFANGYKAETQGGFGRRMTERRITKIKRSGKFYYQGIGLMAGQGA